jgi:heme-degrading monooxygenase HmoA
MIKHIVMWNLAGDTEEDRRKAAEFVRSLFGEMRREIPGLLHLEVGLDHSRVEYACDVVLYTEFESQEALNAYATHPAHLRVKGELGKLRIARFQVDYAVTADALRSRHEGMLS